MSKIKAALIIPNPTWGKTLDLFQTHGYIKIDTTSSEKFKRILDETGLMYEIEQLDGNLTKFTLKKEN